MTEIDHESIACPTCLTHHSRPKDFCENCGAPLGMMSTLDPINAIRAESFMLDRAVTMQRPKLIILVGIWILFLPALLIAFFIAGDQIFAGGAFGSFLFFWIGIALAMF